MQRRTGDSDVGGMRSFDTIELSTAFSYETRSSRDTASSVRRPEAPERNKMWAKMVSSREESFTDIKGFSSVY